MSLFPSQLRRQILAEHAILRNLLRGAEAMVAELRAGRGESLDLLCQRAIELIDFVTAHMALEDRELVPLLKECDFSWGDLRAEQVHADHQSHRAALLQLAEATRRRAVAELIAALELLFVSLREDMEHEELVLDPHVLRDDVVSVRQEDG